MNANFWDLNPRCSGENIQFKEIYICRWSDPWTSELLPQRRRKQILASCVYDLVVPVTSMRSWLQVRGQVWAWPLPSEIPGTVFMHFWEFSYVSVQEFLIPGTLRRGSLWPVTSRWRECINNWIVFTVIVTPGCVCVCVVTNRNGRGGGAQDERVGCDTGVVLLGFDVSSSDFPTLSMNIWALQASFFFLCSQSFP